jgi:hypothetical protein
MIKVVKYRDWWGRSLTSFGMTRRAGPGRPGEMTDGRRFGVNRGFLWGGAAEKFIIVRNLCYAFRKAFLQED